MKRLENWMRQRAKRSYIMMLMAGAYLFYAVYKMLKSLADLTSSPIPIYLFSGLFVVVGLFLCLLGVYALTKGCYSDNLSEEQESGEKDDSASEEDGANRQE